MRVAVIGSGSWGTALSILLGRNGHEVTLYGRDLEEISILRSRRENFKYLPGFLTPPEVSFAMLSDSPKLVDMAVLAIPSGAVHELSTHPAAQAPTVVVASKGLEPVSARLLVEVVSDLQPQANVGVLSGPNLAVEIARQVPTVAVSAFADLETAERVQDAFSNATFRVSVTQDVIGVELAGALKNVLAIGAGMSDGLGFGDNTKGAFLSRGLMEMARLGTAMGAHIETFLGPAGVGDLFATAASRLSRNYRLGYAIGEGKTLDEAKEALGQVAEGVPTSEAAQSLAKQHQVPVPVLSAVDNVLRGKIAPKRAVAFLMERAPKHEANDRWA